MLATSSFLLVLISSALALPQPHVERQAAESATTASAAGSILAVSSVGPAASLTSRLTAATPLSSYASLTGSRAATASGPATSRLVASASRSAISSATTTAVNEALWSFRNVQIALRNNLPPPKLNEDDYGPDEARVEAPQDPEKGVPLSWARINAYSPVTLRCLHIANAGNGTSNIRVPYAGMGVELRPCEEVNQYKWSVRVNDTGVLVGNGISPVWGLKGGNGTVGSNVTIERFELGSASQQWNLTSAGQLRLVSNGTTDNDTDNDDASSNICIQVDENGRSIKLAECEDGAASQEWVLILPARPAGSTTATTSTRPVGSAISRAAVASGSSARAGAAGPIIVPAQPSSSG